MHGKIDGAGEQGFLDFLGEEPFAAGFGERAILNDVAGGANDFNLDPFGVDLGRCGEAALHFAGLKQRKRGTARTNAQQGCLACRMRHCRLCPWTFKC